MLISVLKGKYLMGTPFLLIYKREKKNLIIGMLREKWVHQNLLKGFKAMLYGTSYKIVLGLLYFSKIY